MGTINYSSNDFINLGVNPDNYYHGDKYLDFLVDDDYQQIQNIINDFNFEYFTVKLEPGYYEGFYLHIEFDYLWVDYYEKPLILKELTQLKQLLLKCCNYGMVKYSPGWCMGYSDYKTTIKSIKDCIKETIENIKKYPTYKTYKKGA